MTNPEQDTEAGKREGEESRQERAFAVLEEYVAQLRAGDAPYRDALLARHPDLRAELEEMWGCVEELEGVGLLPSLPQGSAPRRFGRYLLLEEIGRGGMGVVHRAYDPQLDREVALKVVSGASGAGSQALSRFRRESQLIARLSHKNILAVHDAGEHEGASYFTMDLIQGASLADRLGQGRLKLAEGLHILEQVALALHQVHQQGIVHRDIKPSNILLDRDGTPYLGDFGLARDLEGGDRLTLSSAAIGTPPYMSPEQLRGQRDQVDSVSDVYSLGAVLFEILTGTPPYDGGTQEVLKAMQRSMPRIPKARRHKLPRGAETVALKALQHDRRERYQSALELAEELRRLRTGQLPLARAMGPVTRASEWVLRRKRVIAAATLMFALLASTLWMMARGLQTGKAVQAASEQTRNLRALLRRVEDKQQRLMVIAEFKEIKAKIDEHHLDLSLDMLPLAREMKKHGELLTAYRLYYWVQQMAGGTGHRYEAADQMAEICTHFRDFDGALSWAQTAEDLASSMAWKGRVLRQQVRREWLGSLKPICDDLYGQCGVEREKGLIARLPQVMDLDEDGNNELVVIEDTANSQNPSQLRVFRFFHGGKPITKGYKSIPIDCGDSSWFVNMLHKCRLNKGGKQSLLAVVKRPDTWVSRSIADTVLRLNLSYDGTDWNLKAEKLFSVENTSIISLDTVLLDGQSRILAGLGQGPAESERQLKIFGEDQSGSWREVGRIGRSEDIDQNIDSDILAISMPPPAAGQESRVLFSAAQHRDYDVVLAEAIGDGRKPHVKARLKMGRVGSLMIPNVSANGPRLEILGTLLHGPRVPDSDVPVATGQGLFLAYLSRATLEFGLGQLHPFAPGAVEQMELLSAIRIPALSKSSWGGVAFRLAKSDLPGISLGLGFVSGNQEGKEGLDHLLLKTNCGHAAIGNLDEDEEFEWITSGAKVSILGLDSGGWKKDSVYLSVLHGEGSKLDSKNLRRLSPTVFSGMEIQRLLAAETLWGEEKPEGLKIKKLLGDRLFLLTAYLAELQGEKENPELKGEELYDAIRSLIIVGEYEKAVLLAGKIKVSDDRFEKEKALAHSLLEMRKAPGKLELESASTKVDTHHLDFSDPRYHTPGQIPRNGSLFLGKPWYTSTATDPALKSRGASKSILELGARFESEKSKSYKCLRSPWTMEFEKDKKLGLRLSFDVFLEVLDLGCKLGLDFVPIEDETARQTGARAGALPVLYVAHSRSGYADEDDFTLGPGVNLGSALLPQVRYNDLVGSRWYRVVLEYMSSPGTWRFEIFKRTEGGTGDLVHRALFSVDESTKLKIPESFRLRFRLCTDELTGLKSERKMKLYLDNVFLSRFPLPE